MWLSYAKQWFLRAATIAQWFRQRLPSCSSWFESQTQHLRFFDLCGSRWVCICHLDWNVKRTKVNKKRPGLAHFFKKTSELLHNTLWLSHTELVTRLFFNILCSIPDGEVSFGKSPNSIVVVSWQAFTFLLDEKWCKECQRERKKTFWENPSKKLMKNWSFFTKYFIVCYAQKIQKAYSFLVYTFKNAQSRTRCQKQILTQHNMLCRNKALWLEVPRDKGSFNQLECPDSFFLFSSFQQLKDNNMFYKISLYKYLSC